MPNLRLHVLFGARALPPVAAAAVLFLVVSAPVAHMQEAPPPGQQAEADPLDQLLAPVALYPDPLISILLPAATFPSDVAAAGDYLRSGGDPGMVDAQPWDQSVRSLAHYPNVVLWMAGNAAWTQSVGAAFVSEPAQVMEAVQRLRELARAAGTLESTPEQEVIFQGDYVEIEPAQPGVIYVPQYDPAVVFVDQPYYGYNGPFLTFGPAYRAGIWLTYGCDWGGGGVIVVGPDYWHGGGGWWHPYEDHGRRGFGDSVHMGANVHPWGFPAGRERPRAPGGWQNEGRVVHPSLETGLAARPPQSAFRDIHTRGPAAVSAVSRNPAAFKGKPINRAVLGRSGGARPAKAAAPKGSKAKPEGRENRDDQRRPNP